MHYPATVRYLTRKLTLGPKYYVPLCNWCVFYFADVRYAISLKMAFL